MKVKNIMFSGFAAAILMGVAAEANAAPTAKVVASKGYVDAVTGQLGDLTGAASGKANLVDAVNVKLNPVNAVTGGLVDGEYYSSVTQTTDGQVTVSKGELATEIAENVKKAPTTDAVYQAIQEVSGDIKTYYDGTDIDIDENNKVNATYESLDYTSQTDTATNADKLASGGYSVAYIRQTNGKVEVGAKQYIPNVDATTATEKQAPTTQAVYNALQGKQDALDSDQLAAVNSGISAEKVQYYDAIPVMPAACSATGVTCVLTSEAGVYMWSVLAQPYTYTSGAETNVTDGLTAQKQKINTDVNPELSL